MNRSIRALLLAGGLACAAPAAFAGEAEFEMLGKMRQFIEVMQGYYALIDANHSIASNPEKAAILQMQKIQEIYKERGDSAEAVQVLRDVMETTKSDAVRNAAAVLLADTLKESGRATEAIEVLSATLERNIR